MWSAKVWSGSDLLPDEGILMLTMDVIVFVGRVYEVDIVEGGFVLYNFGFICRGLEMYYYISCCRGYVDFFVRVWRLGLLGATCSSSPMAAQVFPVLIGPRQRT